MSKCTIENCEIYPGDADLIKSRAREAHAFAGVSRDPADREYARVLRVAVKGSAAFAEPGTLIPESALETVDYRLTGGLTSRGCLRAVIAP